MSRKEFTRADKVACIKRATKDGQVYCEGCGALAKRFAIDHINADGLTGQPTLSNAQLLCEPCHAEKTKKDVAAIAKAKRREAIAIGAKAPTRNPIPNKPTAKREPRALGSSLPILPRRNIYEGAE